MVANKIRELISATRRSARNVRQTLDEIAEQLIANQRQRQLEVQLERVPVRSPARSHPLANRGLQGPRYGAVGLSKRFYSTSRRAPTYIRSATRSSVSSVTKNIVYQVQPFRISARVGCNFVGSSLYSHFPRHNARMFSTYGQSVAAQATHNLTQGLRATLLKGHQLQSQLMSANYNSSQNVNKAFVDENMELARGESTADGCVVEFNLSLQDQVLPEKFLLDDDILKQFEQAYVVNELEHRMLILNDFKRLKEIIGATVIEHLDNKNVIRCHFPNCEVAKMETMLAESGITTGVVRTLESRASSIASATDSEEYGMIDSYDTTDYETFDAVLTSRSSESEESDALFYFDEHPVLSSSDGLEFVEPVINVHEVYSDMDAIIMVNDRAT
ncbi:hypothetical protein OGAPHI_003245 [Ogataea philodendri]|uniref:Uncharacterized protein n=1 Tax=Ogataea philodendri TaxID=1378263 RepID=A0A9P8T5H2_9ASCO|nr:uncharacterized protein OGAPHI_003245 [Ogataea philodendri]KAH3666796.1 hypothetical protein OGAPHI_003245 [Ogataea philodendri]